MESPDVDTSYPQINREQVGTAVRALLKHIQEVKKKRPSNLLEEGEYIHLVVGLKKTPESGRVKPIPLPLKRPLYEEEGVEVCVITKDPQKEFRELFKTQSITGIHKVVGVSKLRTKYSTYEAKRQLCDSFDLFLADERIVPILPRRLGKYFFMKKKHPAPINFKAKDLQKQIDRARSSTYLHLRQGPCCSVRVARTDFSVDDVVANVLSVAEGMAPHVRDGWTNIQSMHIKTTESVALPIYASLPQVEKESGEEPFGEEEHEKESEKKEKKKKKIKRKMIPQDEEEEEEANMKKLKREKIKRRVVVGEKMVKKKKKKEKT